MPPTRADRIRNLLKGIETGDPDAVAVVDEAKYIQHNPQTHEGSEGLSALFRRLSKTNPRVNVVRAFEDGDFVFGHTEYDFATRRIGFEVFRFEGDKAVEHWDNIQPRLGPNPSGRSMVDGPVEAVDLDKTETNRALVQRFVEQVLIGRRFDVIAAFVGETMVQHSPDLADGREAYAAMLREEKESAEVRYERLHRVLAQGNFVLSACEGARGGVHSALYDLFRVDDGVLVEHWDTVESIAPRSEWKNDNGKF
ncbi:MAG: nuclear transport factor 2 family protein [Sandaracinaceae bacterium]